ncbi:MAG: cell division protein FtsH [Planctomycetota bacterium]|nr:MAG: cell division protein FtsH [Planctomycetota bacterium]
MMILMSLLPWIILFGLFWFFIMRQMRSPGGSGGVLSFGRSRANRYNKEQKVKVSLADVQGMAEAKEEVGEVIEFLKNPAKFQKLGGRIPRGVLLVGPPGTGKTLLAKAIAGEADVPFFSISGSDFVEMFVGVGASRVRDLFKQARESSPCIVFLDEIDAVGRKRGTGMGGGHDEREQTLNAILVEMDGFDTSEGIILIGATNRPDVLDPALLRPGRFDRQVVIDMPDVQGREEILKVHAASVKMNRQVDWEKLARATPGFSGAELASMINEAAILAAMRGASEVEMRDLEEARDRVRFGREKRTRKMLEEDRRVTAFHEAGHALVGARIPEVDPVHKVTIIARGMALGATMYLPDKDDYHMRRSKLLGMIAMSYGGRLAEDIVFGDISAGAQNDIQQATRIARTMVAEWGMSEEIGAINYATQSDNDFLGREFRLGSEHSQETAKRLDIEVKKILDECYERAREILIEDRVILDEIAEALLRYETISGEEVRAIVEGATAEGLRPEAEKPSPPPLPSTRDQSTEEEQGEKAQDGDDEVDLSGAEGFAT